MLEAERRWIVEVGIFDDEGEAVPGEEIVDG